MKILVTGATGKVGSRLVPRLVKWGFKVRALVRDTGKASFLTTSGAELAAGDLLKPESIQAALKDIDAVVHLAAFFRGANEEQARMANVDGSVTLAKASLEAGVKNFIFASTNLVYGSGRGKRVTEIDPPKPAGFYPSTKAEAEKLLGEIFENSKSVFCILRFAFVYGDGDPHIKEIFPVFNGWPSAKRLQMVHHADIAQAVKLSISQKASGIYNVADDAPITISELRQIYGVPDSSGDADISDPWEMIVSNLKIREELGFRPIYPSFYSARDAGAL